MKNITTLLFFFLLMGMWSSCKREPLTLHIIETSDLHGEMGDKMSSLAGYIREEKELYGDNLLVLDCGDNLQGTAETFYFNYIDTLSPHIYSEIFNWLPYDALAIGNHDFETGRPIFERIYSEIKKPVLCANIVDEKSQKPIFKPYTILRRDGYKIAVLGLVSTESMMWLPENLRYGCQILPIRESAKQWVNIIQQKEHPDLLIGLFHAGDAFMRHDSLIWLAKNLPGIDLVCGGHDHQPEVYNAINIEGDTIPVMKPGPSASVFAEAVVTLTPGKKGEVSIKTSTRIISTNDLPPDSTFTQRITPLLSKSKAYNETPICYIDSTICSNDALYGPCAWTFLLHQSYYELTQKMGYTGFAEIDFTIVSASKPNAVLKKGPLTMEDFFLLYPYDNTLSIIEMSGREITAYLEYVHNIQIKYPTEPIYDFDSMGELYYTVAVSPPYGERVNIARSTINDNELYNTRRYRVAMNSFRALGGGGHLEKALGWDEKKMATRSVVASEKILRAMLIDLYKGDTIHTTQEYNWKYIE